MFAFFRRSRSATFAAAAALMFYGAAPAIAHSALHHSEPAGGAVLRVAPPTLILAFNAPVRVTALRLLDESGRERRLAREGERGAAVQEVRAAVRDTLVPGAYRVEWRGASSNGHVGGGVVEFRIEPAE